MRQNLAKTGEWMMETLQILHVSQVEICDYAHMSDNTLRGLLKGKMPEFLTTYAYSLR